MPAPPDLSNAKRARPQRTVEQYPANAQRGIALTDGITHFEILDRQARIGGEWLHLRNMELGAAQWFQLADAGPLFIAGNAERIREQHGYPKIT